MIIADTTLVNKHHKANNENKTNHIELLINPIVLFYKDDLNCAETTKLKVAEKVQVTTNIDLHEKGNECV